MGVDLSPLIDIPLIDVITEDQIVPYEDTDDPLHRTHIINPPNNRHLPWWDSALDAQDIVDIARTTGDEIVALCGYKFVPKANPDKYDVCDPCMRVAGLIMRAEGE